MSVVQKMWSFAKIAYDEPTGKEPLFTDCVSFTSLSTDLDFAYIAEYKDEINIAFRGTDSKDMDFRALKVWVNNLDIYPLQRDDNVYNRAMNLVNNGKNTIEALHEVEMLEEGLWGKGIICKGFYQSFLKFKSWFDEWLYKYTDKTTETPKIELGKYIKKTIIGSGHSRGGTLEELRCRHFAKNCGIKNTSIEFAAPAAGTKQYRHEFRSLPAYATLVINGLDIGPTLPPKILDFRHGAYEETMPAQWFEYLMKPYFKIADHLVKSYDKRIPLFY